MITILTNGNSFARTILEPLMRNHPDQINRVIIVRGDYRGRTGIASLRWLGRATTPPYLVYKIVSLLISGEGVKSLCEDLAIPVEEVASVKELQPDSSTLTVSVSCPQLIPPRLMPNGGINIHSSLLPDYGGLAPYFWVLADGSSSTGTTVHYMSQKFDEGNILGVAELDIHEGESAYGLFHRLARAGAPLLAECVEKALAGDQGVPMLGQKSYRSHPDWTSYRQLRRRGHKLIHYREILSQLRSFFAKA